MVRGKHLPQWTLPSLELEQASESLESQRAGDHLRVSGSAGPEWSPKLAFLTGSQVMLMLLIRVLHFENLCS
jgi:hypothetical protein